MFSSKPLTAKLTTGKIASAQLIPQLFTSPKVWKVASFQNSPVCVTASAKSPILSVKSAISFPAVEGKITPAQNLRFEGIVTGVANVATTL